MSRPDSALYRIALRAFFAGAFGSLLAVLLDRVGGDLWLPGYAVAYVPATIWWGLTGALVLLSGYFVVSSRRSAGSENLFVSSRRSARRSLFLSIAAVCGVSNIVLLAKERYGSPIPKRAEETSLRVVTYNVEKWGFPAKEVAAALVANADPDVICLTEADHYWWQADSAKTPEAFAAELPGYTLAGTREVRIASRWPVLSVAEKSLAPGPSGRPMVDLRVAVPGASSSIHILAVHLVPTLAFVSYSGDRGTADSGSIGDVAEVRRAQAAAIVAYASSLKEPVILCGDFNAAETWAPMRLLRETFDDAWIARGRGTGATSPVGAPRIRIDYVLSRGVTPLHARVLEEVWTSDHHPVFVEFGVTP